MRDGSDRWALLPKLLPLYAQIIAALARSRARSGCRSMNRFWPPILTMPRAPR